MNHDLTTGEPSRVLPRYCLPMFGSILFQQLYNIADSFVAGKWIGENALAAVVNSYEITLVFIAFSFGCNIGTSVAVSRCFGAKKYGELHTTVSTALLSTAGVCAVLMAVGLSQGRALLALIHTPEELMADSALYLQIYVLGLPFLFFYNISTGIFSALGDSRTPFYFLVASSLSNIGVDILFVAGFHMGVAGVAWATFLCQGVSCVLAFVTMLRRVRSIPREGQAALFSGQVLGRIAAVAVPSIFQQCCVSVGNVILQSVINPFGLEVMAGYGAAVKLNNVFISSMATLCNGISTYTSQNLGAGRTDRVHAGFGAGVRLLATICIGMSVLYFACGRWLLLLFLTEPDGAALATGLRFLRTVSPFYILLAFKISADGILRGCGYMGRFMITTLSDLFVRVSLAIVLAGQFGANGIWAAFPLGWVVGTGCAVAFYHAMKQRELPQAGK